VTSESDPRVASPRARPRVLPSLPTGIGLVALYAAMVVTLSIASPYFLSVNNLLNILLAVAVIGVISVGMTMVIISGGLDLSVGAVVALVGVAIALSHPVIGIGPAVILGLLVGVAVGLINGLAVTSIGINPLIATLGTLSLARGLAFVFSGGLTQPVLDRGFGFWGRGFVLGIPVPVIVFAIVWALGYIVLRHTTLGRAIYASGGNPQASWLAGIRVGYVRRLVYLICSAGAAIGGTLLTSQLAAGAPQAATGMELSVIAAVILGGASLSGGEGTLVGTLLGVLIMGTLNNGLVLLNVNPYYQEVARGVVLLLAVGLDQLRLQGR